jgi:hypothetical protein
MIPSISQPHNVRTSQKSHPYKEDVTCDLENVPSQTSLCEFCDFVTFFLAGPLKTYPAKCPRDVVAEPVAARSASRHLAVVGAAPRCAFVAKSPASDKKARLSHRLNGGCVR